MELANNHLKHSEYELAAENYFQAAKLFIEAGKYYKSRDAFITMSVILKEGIKYYPILLEKANSLIKELNNVNVPEISGEILMFCANTVYDLDTEQSAILFEKAYESYAASTLFEEYRDVSVACLLKAAYSYYTSNLSELDKEEQLMLKAVELHHKMEKSVLEIESELSELVRRNQFGEAAEGYKQLAEILLSEIDSLRDLMKEFEDFDAVAVNVKARLIHMAAENLLKATLCSGEGKEVLKTTSQLFEQAVNLMYGLINVERVDSEDIHRFGFDLLLAVILKDKVSGNKEAKEFYNEVLFEMIDEDLRPTVIENKYVKTASFVVDNQSNLFLRSLKSLPIGRFEELREIFTDMIKNL